MGIGINLRAILAILIFLNPLEAAEPPKSKNFIYVVPDGYGVASQGLARDYMSLANKVGALGRPNTPQLEIDTMVAAASSWPSSSANRVPASFLVQSALNRSTN